MTQPQPFCQDLILVEGPTGLADRPNGHGYTPSPHGERRERQKEKMMVMMMMTMTMTMTVTMTTTRRRRMRRRWMMMIMMVESSQWRLLTRKSCALSGSIWMQLRSVQTRQRLHETCSKCRAKSNLCVCAAFFQSSPKRMQ